MKQRPLVEYTAPCAHPGCDWAVMVDSTHPLYPAGPFLCHDHEPTADRYSRELAVAGERRAAA